MAMAGISLLPPGSVGVQGYFIHGGVSQKGVVKLSDSPAFGFRRFRIPEVSDSSGFGFLRFGFHRFWIPPRHTNPRNPDPRNPDPRIPIPWNPASIVRVSDTRQDPAWSMHALPFCLAKASLVLSSRSNQYQH